jgi:hypothetical protein
MVVIELKRAFTTKGMLVALVVGVVLAVHQFYFYQQVGNTTANFDLAVSLGKSNMLLPDYLWGAWLGATPYLFDTYLFFLVLPLLAALPFGASYLQDTRSGFARGILTRTSRKNYYVAKWLATFVSGGCAAAVPLLLNFLLTLTVYPSMGPYPETFHATYAGSDGLLSSLFYGLPFAYVALCVLLAFAFAGVFATLCFMVAWHTDYAFVVLALPFLVTLLVTMVLDLFGWAFVSPIEFLSPGLGAGTLALMLAELAALAALSFALFVRHGVQAKDC